LRLSASVGLASRSPRRGNHRSLSGLCHERSLIDGLERFGSSSLAADASAAASSRIRRRRWSTSTTTPMIEPSCYGLSLIEDDTRFGVVMKITTQGGRAFATI